MVSVSGDGLDMACIFHGLDFRVCSMENTFLSPLYIVPFSGIVIGLRFACLGPQS